MPLVSAGAVLLLAACGGTDDAGKPASSNASTNASSTPAAVALTQADFAPKVRAALEQKGTFHVVSTTTDEEGPATFTADVRLNGAATDLSATGEGSAVVGVGGQLYGKGEEITNDPAKPWVKYDASKKGFDALSGVLIQILATQAVPHQVLGGAAYATSFTSAPGAPVDGVPTTLYTIGIDVPKAVAAKAFGDQVAIAAPPAAQIDA